jgi:hypothetical protein
MRTPRTFLVVALAGLAAFQSGCMVAAVGVAAGYGAHEYVNGQATGVASAGLDRTWRATLAAVERLGLTLKSKTKDATTAEIACTQPDGTGITISLARRSGDFTAIVVKVGLFGDEAKSREIIKTIKDNLR